MHVPVRWRTVVSAATAAFAAIALTAAPAAAATGAQPGGCPDVPTVNPFAPWRDLRRLLPRARRRHRGGGEPWQLEDGAHAVEGNSPFAVGAASDHRSLALPAGASATTAPMCIGEEHRTMRFFGTSTKSGALLVEAIYTKRNGKPKSVTLGTMRGGGDWAASDVLPMRVNERAGADNALSVSLRFTPRGNGDWQIDDVYVDPFRTH